MYKVFSFTNTDEAAPYMDKKILRYIDEQITDSFECFKDCDILAFDWYDVQSEKKEDFKMLLYLDGKDLLVFCETSEAEEKANMILHTMTGEEGATNERLFYHFFSLLLKGDMDFLNNLEEEISNNEDKVLSGDKASYLKYITAWRQELLRLKRYYEQLNFIFDEMTVNDNQLSRSRSAAALSLTPDSGLSRSGTIQSGAGWRKQRRRRGRKRPIPREKSQTGNGHNSFQSGKRGFPL